MSDYDPEAAARAALIQSETAKREHEKQTVEAKRVAMEKTIANLLRDEATKKALGQHGLNVMKNSDQAIHNLMRGANEGNRALDPGECTGFEPRPWDED